MFSKFKQIPLLFLMNINSLINICCFRHYTRPFRGFRGNYFPRDSPPPSPLLPNVRVFIPSLRRSTPQCVTNNWYGRGTPPTPWSLAAISRILYIGRVCLDAAVCCCGYDAVHCSAATDRQPIHTPCYKYNMIL